VRLAVNVPAARALFARVAAQAAAATAVSSWLCAHARDMAPALACEVAPMPVADDLFVAPPDDVPREGLLFVGRLTAQKGVDVLLHALSLLPGDETLSVIGDGPESDALRALATSLGVADRVRWMGALAQHDVAPRYAGARALVVPSREEGLGLVAVEAPAVRHAGGGRRLGWAPRRGS
jgi:glycosyltransferase involved in cell wall biosynthesis